MSQNIDSQIDDLLEQADTLPDSPSKVALIEEAVRLADTHNDLELGFRTRKALMKAGTFGGAPEKALVAFTWCVAQCDRDGEKFDITNLLWEYKWVVSSLRHFPQISRQKIEDAFNDMTRRYEQVGMGLRPIHKLRCRLAMHRGDVEAAQKYQRLWRTAPAGWGSDCPACEQDDQVDYLIFMGKDERALDQARPIIQGRMKCAEVPHVTYAKIMLPLVRLGRLEEAAEYHRRGYRLLADMRDLLEETGDHMMFLTLTGNLDRAAILLEKHLPWALETIATSRRFGFFQAARLLTRRLSEAGRTTLSLRLPKEFPGYREDGEYSVAELQSWFDEDCRQLAEQFDRRNESDSFARKLAEVPTLTRWAVDYPLPASGTAQD